MRNLRAFPLPNLLAAALATAACLPGAAFAQFTPLGFLPGDVNSSAGGISADGLTVVGWSRATSNNSQPVIAVRWQGGGVQSLGTLPGYQESSASAASADGNAIVGYNTGHQAYRWTAGGGMQGLGFLGGGRNSSFATDISSDGLIVVGGSNTFFQPNLEAFRWTSGGMVGLGVAPGYVGSTAQSISGDGQVIVGAVNGADGINVRQAFRWTTGDGMQLLGYLPSHGRSQAVGVSADGRAIVGESGPDGATEAFLWTATNGMIGLGDLPGGFNSSVAIDVSGNGVVIVGGGNTAAGGEAFVWDSGNGMRNLRDVLIAEGATNLAGWQLNVATGVSDDGRTVAGTGVDPFGRTQAWKAQINAVPEPSSLALLGVVGLSGIAWLRRRPRA